MWKNSYSEEEVEYIDCPLCGESNATDVAVEWSLIVAKCSSCEMQYVRRRVINPEWNYRGDRELLLAKYGPYIREEVVHPRERNYQQILDRLGRYRGETGRLLDIGPHMGFFLRAASRREWSVVGVEQSPVLAEIARTYMGLDIRTGYMEEFEFESQFDVVTFLDVLEHITTPVETLTAARHALRPGGVVLAKVPSGQWNNLKHRTIKRIMRDQVDSFDSREHVLQFTSKTLTHAFRLAGLEVAELFVPRPIQTGGPAKRALRWGVFQAGNVLHRLVGTYTALNPDLCLIGMRSD